MGCILACLRFKGDSKKNKAHLKSSPVPSKTKEPLLSKDHFVSVFISEGPTCEQVADLNSQDNIDNDISEKELRDEVKFLKSCGAILETPAELRKESEKIFAQPPDKDITSSNSSSCLPGTPFKKLVWDELEDSDFAQKISPRHNDGVSSSVSLRKTLYLESGPESAVLNVSPSQDDSQIQPHDTNDSVCFGSTEPDTDSSVLDISSSQESNQIQVSSTEDIFLGGVKYDSKIELGVASVVLDVSSSQESNQIQVSSTEDVFLGGVKYDSKIEPGVASVVLDVSPSQDDTQVQPLGSKHSPYPTPLKLTDEMETPGTIYPASLENLRRKNVRVRTQYVYPVINTVEKLTHWTELRDGSKQLGQLEKVQLIPVASTLNNQKDKRSPNREEFDKENNSSVKRMRSLTPLSDSKWRVTPSPKNHPIVVSSLSQWLKPPRGEGEKIQTETCPDRTPDVDRPILGVVSMHWNEDDPSRVSPKWWGGNGIPNTTTKYKEDQKVSWHATPFEERLDKALSDDKLFPRRKDISRKLVAFNDDDDEEVDTPSS